MQILQQKTPSKTWSLIRNKVTGDYLTDDHIAYQTGMLQSMIDEAEHARATGTEPKSASVKNWLNSWRNRDRIPLTDLEILDHIPVVRGKLKFKHAHRGSSSVQIQFESMSGGHYVLEGKQTDTFFTKVGEGKIKLDQNGFYEFNFSFIKKSESVFITLVHDDDL